MSDLMYDPTKVDTTALQDNFQTVEALEKEEELEQQIQQQRAAQQEAEEKELANQPKGFGAELGSAVVGGLVDTVNDITSIPQRAIDLASGEMGRQGDDYEPTWLQIDEDPFETTTWWGGLIRGGINFASLFLGGGKVAKALGLASKFSAVPSVVKGAATGAAVDAVALASLDDNMSSMIIEHFPETEAVLGPLAVRDGDHPMLKVLKNMVEGAGIGIVADLLLMGKGALKPDAVADPSLPQLMPADGSRVTSVQLDNRGRYIAQPGTGFDTPEIEDLLKQKNALIKRSQSAKDPTRKAKLEAKADEIEDQIQSAARKDPSVQVAQRNKSTMDQTVEAGRQDMEEGDGFSPYANKPIAERTQGNTFSKSDPVSVEKQLDQIETDPSAARGSTDNMVTTNQARRAARTGDSADLVKETVKEMVSKSRFQELMAKARQLNMPMSRMSELAVIRFKRVIEGRNTTGMTPDEFLAPLTEKMGRTGGDIDIPYFPRSELGAVDLLLGSLTKQIRDQSMMMRDLVDAVDIKEAGGMMEVLKDRYIATLMLGRRSRYLWSLEGQNMQGGLQDINPTELAETLKNIQEGSRDAANLLFQKMQEDPSENLAKAFTELLSSSDGKDIRTMSDVDALMRRTLREGSEKSPSALTKELQALYVNGALSGPKTGVRTGLGNTLFTNLRYISQALGSYLTNASDATRHANAAALATSIQVIPDAWKVFWTNLGSYMKNDVASIKTRFGRYTLEDQQWEALQNWAETRGSFADKAAARTMNIARLINSNSFLNYSSRVMAATDDAFKFIVARARSSEMSIRKVLDEGLDINDPTTIRRYEDDFYNKFLDEEGNIDIHKDPHLEEAFKEITLQTDLTGASKAFADIFDKSPWLKPFGLFMKTGINGMAMVGKNTPILGALVKKERSILLASADSLDSVRRFGITNAAELENAKALIVGRQAIGSAVTFSLVQFYLSGNLTGNGPADRTKRQSWIDSGWQPRSIRIGDTWISYEAFEPFNTIMAAIADIGDHQQLMGDEWVEEGLTSAAFLVGSAAVSKSFLAGLNQLMELTQGGFSAKRIAASIVNGFIPLSAARNELGKFLNPGMKELNGSFLEAINNRNLFLDPTDLPEKYDLLTGEVIRDWNPVTRFFNMLSPVQFNSEPAPGRDFLIDSGFDIRTSVYSIPAAFGGGNLNDYPAARSAVQKAIGEQNLEKQLAKLAKDPAIQASIAKMKADLRRGDRSNDPGSYYHNIMIKRLFDKAKRKAWAQISRDPVVSKAIADEKERNLRDINNRASTTAAAVQDILFIPK